MDADKSPWRELFYLAGEQSPLVVERYARQEGWMLVYKPDSGVVVPWESVFDAWAADALRSGLDVEKFGTIIDAAEKGGYHLVIPELAPIPTTPAMRAASVVVGFDQTQMRIRDTSNGALLWTDQVDGGPGELHDYPHEGDVGLDLATTDSAFVAQPGHPYKVSAGIAVQLPRGTWGFIHGRSSALNKGILVHSGVIDNGYRGEMFIRFSVLRDVDINPGTRLAQLILMPVVRAYRIEQVDQLDESARGTDGFGSTG